MLSVARDLGRRAASVSDSGKRVTVSVQELALANSLTLAALVELLEEKGVVSQAEVLERTRVIQDKKKPV